MKNERKQIILIAASSIVIGQDAEYKIYLPIIFGDGSASEQTPTPTLPPTGQPTVVG